jgi:hypothetical protein
MSTMGTRTAMNLVSPAGNLLSLLVIDDERAIREACRESPRPGATKSPPPRPQSGLFACCKRSAMPSRSSIYASPEQAVSKPSIACASRTRRSPLSS